jgi:hypothetical protein
MTTGQQILNGDSLYMIPSGATGLFAVANTRNNQNFDTYTINGTGGTGTVFTIYATDAQGNITGTKGTPVNNFFTLIRKDNNNRLSYCMDGNVISYVSGNRTQPYNLSKRNDPNGISCDNILFSVAAEGTKYLNYGVPYILNGSFGNIEVGPSGVLDMNEVQSENNRMVFYKFEDNTTSVVKQSSNGDSTIYFLLILILLTVALFFIMKNTSFKL